MPRLYPPQTPTTGTRVGMAISGVFFDLANPKAEDVHVGDIMFQMARLPRYNGATLTPNIWTVGDHLRVCDAVYLALCAKGALKFDPMIRVAILLHDGAEIYTGDLVSPYKRLLRQHGDISTMEILTDKIDDKIAERFHLRKLTVSDHELIKDVDMFAYEVEKELHRPVFSDDIEIHPLTKELLELPEITAFNELVGLAEGWRSLRNLFFVAAADLKDKTLLHEVAACENPYTSGAMKRIMDHHKAAHAYHSLAPAA